MLHSSITTFQKKSKFKPNTIRQPNHFTHVTCSSPAIYGTDGPVFRNCVERTSLNYTAVEDSRVVPSDGDFPFDILGGTEEVPVAYYYCIENGCNESRAAGSVAPLAVAVTAAVALALRAF